ncbi:MAG TPA: hypothetical protein ENF57_00505 [Candidatus Korarchaeota archaeon]|nr:hypothetical protein [Candidatus Korarchaeota archaeon]
MSEILELTKFLLNMLINVAKWLDSAVKTLLVPILTQLGLSEGTANTVVIIIELIVAATLVAKISGILRWVLILILLLLLLGAFYPV